MALTHAIQFSEQRNDSHRRSQKRNSVGKITDLLDELTVDNTSLTNCSDILEVLTLENSNLTNCSDILDVLYLENSSCFTSCTKTATSFNSNILLCLDNNHFKLDSLEMKNPSPFAKVVLEKNNNVVSQDEAVNGIWPTQQMVNYLKDRLQNDQLQTAHDWITKDFSGLKNSEHCMANESLLKFEWRKQCYDDNRNVNVKINGQSVQDQCIMEKRGDRLRKQSESSDNDDHTSSSKRPRTNTETSIDTEPLDSIAPLSPETSASAAQSKNIQPHPLQTEYEPTTIRRPQTNTETLIDSEHLYDSNVLISPETPAGAAQPHPLQTKLTASHLSLTPVIATSTVKHIVESKRESTHQAQGVVHSLQTERTASQSRFTPVIVTSTVGHIFESKRGSAQQTQGVVYVTKSLNLCSIVETKQASQQVPSCVAEPVSISAQLDTSVTLASSSRPIQSDLVPPSLSCDSYLDSLLDHECAMYSSRLTSVIHEEPVLIDRGVVDPLSLNLSQGDERHFIPIEDDLPENPELEDELPKDAKYD